MTRSSAGFAGATIQVLDAKGDRWGVSGGAALAPPEAQLLAGLS